MKGIAEIKKEIESNWEKYIENEMGSIEKGLVEGYSEVVLCRIEVEGYEVYIVTDITGEKLLSVRVEG